jgi:hypothetical protein
VPISKNSLGLTKGLASKRSPSSMFLSEEYD